VCPREVDPEDVYNQLSWQQRGRVLNAIKTKFWLVSSPIGTANRATTV